MLIEPTSKSFGNETGGFIGEKFCSLSELRLCYFPNLHLVNTFIPIIYNKVNMRNNGKKPKNNGKLTNFNCIHLFNVCMAFLHNTTECTI